MPSSPDTNCPVGRCVVSDPRTRTIRGAFVSDTGCPGSGRSDGSTSGMPSVPASVLIVSRCVGTS